MAGRYAKINVEATGRIVDAIRKGSTKATAAYAGGITTKTLYNWLSVGRKAPEGPYGEFLRAVEAAEAECARAMEQVVVEAAGWRDEVVTKEKLDEEGSLTIETTSRRVCNPDHAKWWLERRIAAYSPVAREIKELKAQVAALLRQVGLVHPPPPVSPPDPPRPGPTEPPGP